MTVDATPRSIRTPSSAEAAALRIIRAVQMRILERLDRYIREAWPLFEEERMLAIAREELRAIGLRKAIRRIARLSEASIAAQLSEILARGQVSPTEIAGLSEAMARWQKETQRLITAAILGDGDGVIDSGLREDGIKEGLVRSVARAQRGARDVTHGLLRFLTTFRKTAAQVERAVVNAVVRGAAVVNRVVQTTIGIEEYTWVTKRDDRVRDSHALLDSTRQRWDSPPEISTDGRRGHPGDDFNCRCVAIPILPTR